VKALRRQALEELLRMEACRDHGCSDEGGMSSHSSG